MNGKTCFKGKLPRTVENMKNSLEQRGDIRYLFPAQVTVQL
jgi:hypothetical protein